MRCGTCGVYGHDSHGHTALCLEAVKSRMFTWAKLAGEACASLDKVKRHHHFIGAFACQACKEGKAIHERARAMAAEDGLV